VRTQCHRQMCVSFCTYDLNDLFCRLYLFCKISYIIYGDRYFLPKILKFCICPVVHCNKLRMSTNGGSKAKLDKCRLTGKGVKIHNFLRICFMQNP